MKLELLDLPLGASQPGEPVGLRGSRYILGTGGGPRVLITGAVHGDEPTATAALWYLADRLTDAALEGVVTIIPCVNVLALRASSRLIPHEQSDLNRCFGGRRDGSLAERLAAVLVRLLDDHDALIDVHTAGWCVPFVLLDHAPDLGLLGRVARWASATTLPVVGEMPAEQSSLQGLDRSWSAWAMNKAAKPALTLELVGYRTLNSDCAKRGGEWLLDYVRAAASLAAPVESRGDLPFRREIYADASGLFETLLEPGTRVQAGETVGLIRRIDGAVRETVVAAEDGLVLALQPISAVHVGSWLATLAVSR
jgi:predicted deacylase